jgi:hypothetical protein
MKARFRISLIVYCALIQCASYAFVSNPAAQQGAANSTIATSDHLTEDERTTLPIETKNHGTASHQPAHKRYVSSKIPVPTHAVGVQAHSSKMARNNNQAFKSRNPVADRQPMSIKLIAASKATNHNLPTQPVANSGIGGLNFRNRHLTPIPSGIGGPGRTTRDTSPLSGTGMGRRPLN